MSVNWEDSMQACDVERLTENYELESTQFGSEIMWRFVPIQKPKPSGEWLGALIGWGLWLGLLALAIHEVWQ